MTSMDTDTRNIRVARGKPRRVRGAEARRKIDRELHGIVVQVREPEEDRVPRRFADWWYDLRRKRLRVYGGLLRFIDCCRALGVPKRVPKMIPALLDSYIDDLYDDADSSPNRAA